MRAFGIGTMIALLILGLVSCSSSEALPDPPATEQEVFGSNGWYISVPDSPVSLAASATVWIMARRAGELTLEVRTGESLVEPGTIPVSESGVDKWILVPILGSEFDPSPGLYDIRLLDEGGDVLAEAQLEVVP